MAASSLLPFQRGASLFTTQLLHITITSSLIPFTPLATPKWQRYFVQRPRNLRPLRAGLCFAALIPKDEKKDLLAGVDKSNVEAVAQILEQAKKAVDRWEVSHSDFLTPPAIEDALKALKRLSDVGVVVCGGYPQAERCRLSVGHNETISMSTDKNGTGYPGAVAAISVLGDFMIDKAVHGDFLGAVLSTGLAREKIGDIIVQGDLGAQIIVVPELADYLVASLTQVRRTPVLCTQIPLTDLQIQPPRFKVIKAVEASLRVDALASAGFSMSRSKLVELISSGDVRVNWKEVTKNGVTVKTGDVISVGGKGRLEVGEITTTKKGRYAVELLRFL